MTIRGTHHSIDRTPVGGPASLTDLFETDALLDLLSGRSATARDDRLGEEPVLHLLQALATSVDTDLDQGEPDPVVIAALAAGFELAASALDADVADDDLSLARFDPAHRLSTRRRDTLHVVGGRAGRRVRRRRPLRAAAVVAGVALVLGGGGFAAAATTDPSHAWGPLKPVVRALHPGWQADLFAAKRDAILRTLDRASQQSMAGQRVAAAVTYGTARQQARDLPKGPDAVLRDRLAAVARQLGIAPELADPADPADPAAGTLPGPASVDPGTGTGTYSAPDAPTGGAAPDTLPPVQPAPSSTSDSGTPGATDTTSTTDSTGAGTGTTTGDTTGSTNSTDPTAGSTAGTSAAAGDSTASSGAAGAAADSSAAPTADSSPSPQPSPVPSPAPTDPGPGGGTGATPPGTTSSVDGGLAPAGAGTASDPSAGTSSADGAATGAQSGASAGAQGGAQTGAAAGSAGAGVTSTTP